MTTDLIERLDIGTSEIREALDQSEVSGAAERRRSKRAASR